MWFTLSYFFFSSRRRHTRFKCDWSSDVCSSDLASQTAGNLNVVVVGWNDTQAAVSKVSDTAGNVYALAVGPTPGTELSQSVYYAKNIVSAAAGAKRVTVHFSPAAAFPYVRILAYRRIHSPNPV